ncbi:MAG: hypothetical protein POH28_13115 [Acidocella sp.]|nr:hypothetical protein [Acidocella sp.]
MAVIAGLPAHLLIGKIVRMAASHKWRFKSKFRTNAFGWNSSRLAIDRLKAADAEIRSVAKSNPLLAGEGVVSLAERIWPSLQGIDSSSGALGSAVFRTLDDLIPIVIAAPASPETRSKWMARLFDAIQEEGVDYLSPIEERWGEIAQYPELMDGYVNLLIATIRRAWSDHETFSHVAGTSICLSSLLELGRYDDLQELLGIQRNKFWPHHRYGAQALLRQGLWEGAIAFAEAARSQTNPGFYETAIDRFCEAVLIKHNRADEAYRLYGLRAAKGSTNLAVYRALVGQYPNRDRRQMLLDLINSRGDKGKWFAAAKDAGFLDIAIECAASYGAEPSTLTRAARDFLNKEPNFAATVALLSLSSLLSGGGYDPAPNDAIDTLQHLFAAALKIGTLDWARDELGNLAVQRCAPDREPFQKIIQSALTDWRQRAATPKRMN